jgi:tetratricopeptide (TPR) repeat protein
MTAGIPGAGIGGLFYLANAFWMPFREIRRALHGRSSRASRQMVRKHVTLASGILTSMWVAAWMLTRVLTSAPTAVLHSQSGIRSSARESLPRLLSYSALLMSGITLVLILGAVQILRLVIADPRRMRIPTSLFLMIAGCGLVFPLALSAQENESREVFKRAQALERRDPEQSEQLYRRYIRLEPEDAWGYIVLAEFLGRSERFDDALALYVDAMRLAPGERDAAYGQARMLGRAGRTEQSINAYEKWISSHPDDAQAWRDLARERQRAGRVKGARVALEQAYGISPSDGTEARLENIRRLAAPVVEPIFGLARESDGISVMRTAAGANFLVADGTRVGFTVGRSVLSDPTAKRKLTDFMAGTMWRPRAGVQVEAEGGAVRTVSVIPVARGRLRVTAPENKAGLDLRFNRTLLDASPALLDNRIARNEVQARPNFALSRRLRVRGTGGAGWFEGAGETNSRRTAGAGAGWNLRPNVELSGNFAETDYAHPTRKGYFAPERLQSMDAGTYMEFENDSTLIALDLGGGVERFKIFGGVFGRWAPALRGYMLLSHKIRPGRDLRLEFDSYRTQAAPVDTPNPGWKHFSLTASFRWSLP